MRAPRYRRLTLSDRCQILACLEMDFSQNKIAQILGKSKSTISRELQRNQRCGGRYCPAVAEKMSKGRRAHCHRPLIVTGHIESMVVHHLLERWSPEQISGRMKLENIDGPCKQSIYNFIYQRSYELRTALTRYNKRGFGRHRYKKIEADHLKNRLHISLRPAKANTRKEFGHWERDTMVVRNKEQILVCVERKSRFTRLDHIPKLRSKIIDQMTVKLTKNLPHPTLSATNDNGSYFKPNNKMPFPVFFCTPHKPQQRGTVENTIGKIRKEITTKTPINENNRDQLKELEKRLNNTPRKVLDFKTPYEILFDQSVALLI